MYQDRKKTAVNGFVELNWSSYQWNKVRFSICLGTGTRTEWMGSKEASVGGNLQSYLLSTSWADLFIVLPSIPEIGDVSSSEN